MKSVNGREIKWVQDVPLSYYEYCLKALMKHPKKNKQAIAELTDAIGQFKKGTEQ